MNILSDIGIPKETQNAFRELFQYLEIFFCYPIYFLLGIE